MARTFKRNKSLAILAGMLMLSTSVLAQADKAVKEASSSVPAWKWMDIVAFNANPAFNFPAPTPLHAKLAEQVWRKEIKQVPLNTFSNNQTRLPSFILISSHKEGSVLYTFSIFDAADAPGCIPAGNGSGVVDMYSECPIRVTATDEATGRSVSQQFDDYCHLFVNDSENPSSKNHTEILIDPAKGVARFRIIQHGKQVPQCNRTLKYKEVKS